MDSKNAHTPDRTPLNATQIIARLATVEGWKLHGDGADVAIEKTFQFDNYLKVLAFANAVAYLAEQRDHHPDMLLRFGSCSVRFNTHSAQGITSSDFASAAQVDALFSSSEREA
jgi:4a-hydroxytetrahydrobiopterin dehydratase